MISKANWLGLTEYEKAQSLQFEIADEVRKSPQIQILGLEHPGVITLGKRADTKTDLLWDAAALEKKSLKIQKIDRGGQATLHSRGQLVIYPLLPLQTLGIGVKTYVDLLLKTTIDLLKENQIEAFEKEGSPGVFTATGKIAFCGVRIDRGVTRHGISLNVQNDLELFACIRSCGNSRARLDSVQFYKSELSLEKLFTRWSEIFIHRLGDQLKESSIRLPALQWSRSSVAPGEQFQTSPDALSGRP